ncbi:MAG: 50S ribosomal protein L11 [Alphaproteobacteria bacterium]|nr:50S ribosomal protein L11 [Alphaproteobacteria bacterium]MBQ4084533.1 50S ribosomal protein L11 [Alphaproteobacteria bacterium]
MAKKIIGFIKLQIPAGKANPSPPVGPALGQRGLNIMEFCKAFNAATQKMEPGMPIPVVITAYADRTFSFVTKLPPVSYFIKQAAGLKSASKEPGKVKAGKLTMAQVREIAEKKLPDLNCTTVESAMNTVAGQARSMGVEVEGV